MEIDPQTPQRLAIVIEQNKSGTWSVAAYLMTADGRRERSSLSVFKTYRQAAASLRQAWSNLSL